jgi:hypothetical protein
MKAQREWKEDVLETACERFERRLSEEIGAVRLEMANLRVDTTQQMARMHTSLLRWMFVFWIGQLMTAIGIVITVLRVAKLL